MSTKTKNRPQTRIQREKTEEIMGAALDVFAQSGFRGASVNKIAELAGMSTPSMLYYFSSKEDIHRELLARVILIWSEPLALIGEGDEPIEDLLEYARQNLALSHKYPRENKVLASEIMMGMPRAGEGLFDQFGELFHSKVALIEEWQQGGKIASVDPYHLMYTIWATTQSSSVFEEQIKFLSPDKMPTLFADVEAHLIPLFRCLLTPQ